MEKIVVVGAGQAGASCVMKLRAEGFGGSITLIGEEPVPPYQRPPLSKAYLLGEMALERLYLRPESFYEDNGITLILGQKVERLDRAARCVIVGGETVAYDQLVLATGSVPRRLPEAIGGALGGVHVVRGLRDVDVMEKQIVAGKRALIVGGGYIGLEAAAVARKRGMEVTLIEMAERILQRVACAETSDFFRELHRAHGVDIREGVGLERLVGSDHVTGVILSDGTELAVDVVIVGIGIAPAAGLAQDADLKVENGIVVDEFGRTGDPAIWAAGDCAVFPYKGAMIRLESVQNAIDQAEAVARNILGKKEKYEPKPWFWSDQYDVKLQIAGLNTGYDRVVARVAEGMRSHWYFGEKTLLAVDAMNDPRGYMIGKRLIEAGKSPAPEVVGNPDIDLKPLLKD
jgi:3-phenylpropionate/trans-cinnamate dioxygenase ferredoxin reductase component